MIWKRPKLFPNIIYKHRNQTLHDVSQTFFGRHFKFLNFRLAKRKDNIKFVTRVVDILLRMELP